MHDRTLKTPKIGVKRKYPFEMALPTPEKRFIKKAVTNPGNKDKKFVVPNFKANADVTTTSLLNKEVPDESNANCIVKNPK